MLGGLNEMLSTFSLVFKAPCVRSSTFSVKKSKGYWDNEENILKFLNNIKQKLNLHTPEQWNTLTAREVKSNGGSTLLRIYKMEEIKSMGCKEGELLFKNDPNKKPVGYWNNPENVQKFLNNLKVENNLNSILDWNTITTKQIIEKGGSNLLELYSLSELKTKACPEGKSAFIHDTNQRKAGYWQNIENVTKFLSKLKEKYHFNTPEDWNSMNSGHIISNGGGHLAHIYSIYDLKVMACPEGISVFSKPNKSPGYWDNDENIYIFLNELKEKYDFQTLEDWDSISTQLIISEGGRTILQKKTIFQLKCMAFPEGKLKFSNLRKPSGYWNNHENVKDFLEKLKIELDLKTYDDWKRLSKNQVMQHGGRSLLDKFSKDELIQLIFPSKPNNDNYSFLDNSLNGRSSQRWLFLQLQKLFPGEEMVEDYFHSEISRKTGYAVQFDVFLVKRSIAFEYHGKQHYEDIPAFAPMEMYQTRDEEKQMLCKESNIELIVIPYWWDNSLEALKTTINNTLHASKLPG